MSQIDKLLQQELQLQRIATGLINKGLFPSLDAAYKAVRAILLDAETITSPTKLKATERAIAAAINEALAKGWSDYTSELGKIAIYDVSFYAQLIGTAAATELTVPAAKTIQSFIDSSLMSLSRGNTPTVGVWADFVRNNIDSFSGQVNNLVKAGYVNNATVNDIKKSIAQFLGFPDREKPDGMSEDDWQKIKDRTDGLGKRQIDALARTGTQHYMQSAREAMGQANADIIAARVFFATMDNRVSVGCASLHLKEWAFTDDGYVRLPRHFNCRSTYLLRLKGQSKEDLLSVKRPAIGSGSNYESGDLYKGRTSSRKGQFDVEQIDASVGFDKWLKRQDREFVEDVLGAQRARLFIDGNVPIERMSDAFGKELTLAELAAKNKAAFDRAGLG